MRLVIGHHSRNESRYRMKDFLGQLHKELGLKSLHPLIQIDFLFTKTTPHHYSGVSAKVVREFPRTDVYRRAWLKRNCLDLKAFAQKVRELIPIAEREEREREEIRKARAGEETRRNNRDRLLEIDARFDCGVVTAGYEPDSFQIFASVNEEQLNQLLPVLRNLRREPEVKKVSLKKDICSRFRYAGGKIHITIEPTYGANMLCGEDMCGGETFKEAEESRVCKKCLKIYRRINKRRH